MTKRYPIIAVAVLSFLVPQVGAQVLDFTGTYVIESVDGTFTLVFQQAGSGSVQGQLTGGGLQLSLMGGREPLGISGTATAATGETYGFTARLQDELLQLQLYPFDYAGNPVYAYAETLIFSRQAGGAAQAPNAEAPATTGGRSVSINRVKLDRDFIEKVERQYGTRVPDGRYWYDATCGAWGFEGGPTQGFIMANLELPGPMPADISGGGTGIFFNGREIHVQDQLALQQVFGFTIPGRYWLDALGYLGVESSTAPIANLAAAVQSARGGQYGSTTGVGGTAASDGQGGSMFSGRTPSGKSVFWYSGQ